VPHHEGTCLCLIKCRAMKMAGWS